MNRMSRVKETAIVVSVVILGWLVCLLLIGGYAGMIMAAAWSYAPIIPLTYYFEYRAQRSRIKSQEGDLYDL